MSGQKPVCRSFAGEADVEPFVAMLKDMIEVDKGDLVLSLNDIRMEWVEHEEGWVRNPRVWDVDGRFAAAIGAWFEFGNPADTAYAEIATHPEYRTTEFVDEVLLTTIDAVAGMIDRPVALRFGASETQEWLIDGAERTGFALDTTYYRMVREIPDLVPVPELPDGFVIRPLAGESEFDEWVETFNVGFASHHDPPTYSMAEKQARAGDETYLPETDLILVAPDGSFAGLSLNIKERLKLGEERAWVRSIALRPEWRGKGLGAILLRTSLNALHTIGFRTIRLSVDSDNNVTALDLYESAGFSIEFRRMIFVRNVVPC